jgi:hypothetical protein
VFIEYSERVLARVLVRDPPSLGLTGTSKANRISRLDVSSSVSLSQGDAFGEVWLAYHDIML